MVHLARELPNSPTVAIYTEDGDLVGWIPMFLAHEIALAPSSARYEARVVRVNPPSVPLEPPSAD